MINIIGIQFVDVKVLNIVASHYTIKQELSNHMLYNSFLSSAASGKRLKDSNENIFRYLQKTYAILHSVND